MLRFFRFIRRHLISTALILVALLGLTGWLLFGGSDTPTFVTIAAERGTVQEEVSVVGRIRATERLELGLESTGKVAFVGVQEGERVKRGQTLVSLTNADLGAQLRAAQAGVTREQAALDRLFGGRSDADRALQDATITSSRTTRDNAQEALRVQLAESYVTLDSSLGTNIDPLFDDARTNPNFGTSISAGSTRFAITASQADRSRLNRGHQEAVRLLETWRTTLTTGDDNMVLQQAETGLRHLQLYLSDLALVINRLTPDSTTNQALYQGFQADVAATRAAVNTATAAISNAKQARASAEASLAVTERQGSLRDATESSDIRIQRASLEAAEAQVDLVRAQIARTTIVSPVDGIAAVVTAEVGEIASGNVVTLIADAPLEIEAQVAESDIAKIRVDNEARVTLDAYSGELFTARVIYVAPAEIEIEGVPTYKVRLALENQDERLKPGMSADLDIATKKRENVIAIPQRAVITRDGQKIVRIAEGDVSREIVVKTGIRGTDGRIEITEGLSEGIQVIVATEEN
jgi:HlyD family secretion protein